ncbi:MAG: hypothetical protein J6T97_06855 [Bacteroidaceae bacterium]|nr:hypothetical protein [Bacteroidaceae bacterium]
MKKILLFVLFMMSLTIQAGDITLLKDENPSIGDENDDRSSATSPTASIDYRELTVFTGVIPANIVIKDSNLNTVLSEYVSTNPLAVLDLALLPSGQYSLYLYIDGVCWTGTFYLD